MKNTVKENSPLNENIWENQTELTRDKNPFILGSIDLGNLLLQRQNVKRYNVS